ncbi:MAG: hypothetical protein V4543_02110 [Bacteroidota bacterium]
MASNVKPDRNLWIIIFRALFVRKWREWRAVTACLLAATVIWLLNALNKDYVTQISYPIRLVYDEKQILPVTELPRTIDMNVSADGWHLLRRTFWYKIPPVIYTPPGLPATKFVTALQLLSAAKEQMSDLQINYVVTDSLYTDFSPVGSRKFRVVADTTALKFSDGYRRLSPIRISPDCVQVTGASIALAAMPPRIVVKLPSKTVDETYQEVLPLPFPETKLITPVNKEVLIEFAAGNGYYYEVLLPVYLENCNGMPDSLSYMARVGYVVPKDLPEGPRPFDQFRLIADCSRKERGKVQIVLIKMPEGIEKTGIYPEEIDLNRGKRK